GAVAGAAIWVQTVGGDGIGSVAFDTIGGQLALVAGAVIAGVLCMIVWVKCRLSVIARDMQREITRSRGEGDLARLASPRAATASYAPSQVVGEAQRDPPWRALDP